MPYSRRIAEDDIKLVRAAVERLAAKPSDTQLFFSSPSKPGLKVSRSPRVRVRVAPRHSTRRTRRAWFRHQEADALLMPTQDFWVLGPQRMIAATSPDNLRRTFVEGGLGGWVERMEAFLGPEWTVVTERDPKA